MTDEVPGVERDLVPRASLTALRLRATRAELGRRLAARGRPTDDLAQQLAYSDTLDRAFATEPSVDTTGLSVIEVVDRVRAATGWPDLTAPVCPSQRPPDETPGDLWVDTDHRPADEIAAEIVRRTGWRSPVR